MTECYECSRLAELVAQNTAMRVKLGTDAPEKPVGTLGRLADANDALAPENGVSAEDADDANADSREKLEADVRKWCGKYAYQADMVWTWLNRQAAITERECRKPNWEYCETCELQATLEELRDKLGEVVS